MYILLKCILTILFLFNIILYASSENTIDNSMAKNIKIITNDKPSSSSLSSTEEPINTASFTNVSLSINELMSSEKRLTSMEGDMKRIDTRMTDYQFALNFILTLLAFIIALAGYFSYRSYKNAQELNASAEKKLEDITKLKLEHYNQFYEREEKFRNLIKEANIATDEAKQIVTLAKNYYENIKNNIEISLDNLTKNSDDKIEKYLGLLTSSDDKINKILNENKQNINDFIKSIDENEDDLSLISEEIDSSIFIKMERANKLGPLSSTSWNSIFINNNILTKFKNKFLKNFDNKKLNEKELEIFIEALYQSFSLSVPEKKKVIDNFNKLSSYKINRLIELFIDEKIRFINDIAKEYPQDIFRVTYEIFTNWFEIILDDIDIRNRFFWKPFSENKLFKDLYKEFDKKILDLNNKVTLFYAMLGFDLHKNGLYNESIIILTKSFESGYEYSILSIYELIVNEKGEDEAITYIYKYYNEIKDENIKLELLTKESRYYFKNNKLMAAVRIYDKIKRLNPKHYSLLECMELNIFYEDYSEALKVFDKDPEFDEKKYNYLYHLFNYICYLLINKDEIANNYFVNINKIKIDKIDWNVRELNIWLKKLELDINIPTEKKEKIKDLILGIQEKE